MSMISVKKLPASRWKECRDLRLEALKEEPQAFGSLFEDEKCLTEPIWKDRIGNALFALDGDRPIGMVVMIAGKTVKTSHIGNLYGLYVKTAYRKRAIGHLLVSEVIKAYQGMERIRKIKLAVNGEQTAAINLYERLGFSIAGRLKEEIFYDDKFYDEYIMEMAT